MKNNNALRAVLIMGAAVIAVGGGLVYWQYSARSAAAARVAALEAELPDAEQLEADLLAAETQLSTIQMELDHLERGVPSIAYIPTLLKELEAVGSDNAIKVTGVRPVVNQAPAHEDKAADKAYFEQEIDITGQGSYRAVMDMIAALQKFPKILAVRTVTLAPRRDRNDPNPGLDATVRLRAYVFNEQPEEGDTDEEATTEVAMATHGVKGL